ncbi:MAG: hypothetical protein EYC70_16080 [Planctomycetota bacterium]|nr:MAG: hypothetical protein EYC70_16080 [Planctomycetota bacterium]
MDSPAVVPLFPLPNVLLYPDAILPLHVFEPRYVQMVEDLQESGNDRIALGLMRPGWEPSYFENPPVFDVAGLGRMLQCSRTSEGRFNILVQGLTRVRLVEESPSGRLYRTVRVDELAEIPPPDSPDVAGLHQSLREGLIEFAEGSLLLSKSAPLSYLADILIVALPLDVAHKQELFSILDVEERARRVLECLRDINDRRRSLKAAGRRSGKMPWN